MAERPSECRERGGNGGKGVGAAVVVLVNNTHANSVARAPLLFIMNNAKRLLRSINGSFIGVRGEHLAMVRTTVWLAKKAPQRSGAAAARPEPHGPRGLLKRGECFQHFSERQ